MENSQEDQTRSDYHLQPPSEKSGHTSDASRTRHESDPPRQTFELAADQDTQVCCQSDCHIGFKHVVFFIAFTASFATIIFCLGWLFGQPELTCEQRQVPSGVVVSLTTGVLTGAVVYALKSRPKKDATIHV